MTKNSWQHAAGSRQQEEGNPDSYPRAARCQLLTVFLVVLLFALCALPSEAHALQLLVQVTGAAVGFFFGGPLGAAIGGAAGGLLGGLLFGPKAPTIYGPRLQDKTVQSAAQGAHINRTWGTDRVPAQVVFSSPIKETTHKTKVGGKGLGSSQTSVTYTYSVDIMLSFGRKAKGIKRLWADTKLIYDVSGTADIKKKWQKAGKRFTVRDGSEDQLPSALEESYHGAGLCSAHRGLFCIEFADLQLADFANRIPNFTAEIFTEGETTFSKIASLTAPAAPYSWWIGSWGYIDSFGDIYALYYPFATPYPYPGYAKVFHWTLDRPTDPTEEFETLWSDGVVQESSTAGRIRVRSNEPSAAVYGTNGQGIALSYFQLAANTRIDILSAQTGGFAGPSILARDDDAIYVFFESGGLIKFNSAGTKITDSTVIFDTTGSGTIADLNLSDGYLWALVGHSLLQIDRDDLSLVAQYDLSSIANPLAIAAVSDTEIRVFSSTAASSEFYIITPGSAPALDQTVGGYSGLTGFSAWGLHYVNDLYFVEFAGYWGGFGAFIDVYGTQAPTEDIPLWKIQRDICLLAGLDSVIDTVPPTVGDIDVDELTDLVHGYSITRAMTARDASVQLAQTYFYDCRERDLKLEFVKRGKAAVASIPGTDLAVRTALTEALPDRLTQVRQRETELPIRIHVIYNNWEAAYQSGHEYAPRLITDARATVTIEIAVAITSTKAKQVADATLASQWLERETFTAKANRKYLQIDAADNVEIVSTET